MEGPLGLPALPWQQREITSILPHRPPFLFVDRVLEVEPDRRIRGEKWWAASEGLITTRNGRAMVPASLLMEAMAQLGASLILMKEENRGKIIYFMGIEKVRYRSPLAAGETLSMEAEVVRLRARIGTLTGRAEVAGRAVANGTMHFALGAEA